MLLFIKGERNMPSELELKFTKRVNLFFRFRRVYLELSSAKELIKYLYDQFESQGRFKDPDAPFFLTPKFMINALSNYLKINPAHGVGLFRDIRDRRSSARYSRIDSDDRKERHPAQGIIHLLGRKHKPEYKLTKRDGQSLSPARVAKTDFSAFNMSFSPLEALPVQAAPRARASSADGSLFEQDIISNNMSLWRKRTPQKEDGSSPYRVRCSKPALSYGALSFAFDAESKKETKEFFEFTVTQEDVIQRVGVKRPIDQKMVMGGVSAVEVMKAIGVIVTEKQSGKKFHWAHRRGWSLHGEQDRDNFDPMTAGSNYDTLFKIEAPLKDLLFEKNIDEVFVKGEVEFDKENGLPFKISYNLSWGTLGFIQVIIDPMSHRVPTVDEHEVAKTFFGAAVIP